MSIRILKDEKLRLASDLVAVKDQDGLKRTAYIMLIKFGEQVYVMWQKIFGYLFSKDSQVMVSKDGYIMRAKDQL